MAKQNTKLKIGQECRLGRDISATFVTEDAQNLIFVRQLPAPDYIKIYTVPKDGTIVRGRSVTSRDNKYEPTLRYVPWLPQAQLDRALQSRIAEAAA